MAIPTNCGDIKPINFEVISLGADHTSGHIPYFHRMMCNWAYSAALPFMWVIIITADNKNNLISNIKQINNYEVPGWDIDSLADDTWTDATMDVIGCIFAQGVRLPGEGNTIEYAGISDGSKRGFINAPIMNGRSDFEPLEIGFLETNQSFVDGVLRPWKILMDHKGFIATDINNSLKSTISVYELAKAGPTTKNIIRKAWNFYKCAPTNLSSSDKTYAASADYEKKQVQFLYNYYTVGSGKNL